MEIDAKVPGALAETRGKGRDVLTIISVALVIVGFVVLLAFL